MGDEPDEFVCRCGLVVKDHHLSIACDICDQWFHVQCCGLAKEQSEKIAGSFMCKGCHAEGFMGGGADWYIEPADSKPVPLPESSSSEEEVTTVDAQTQQQAPRVPLSTPGPRKGLGPEPTLPPPGARPQSGPSGAQRQGPG